MTTFTLEPQYLFKLASMPRGFQTTEPLLRKCTVPYNTISVDYLGNCILCECDGWLPLPVGKVLEFETIDEVFASSAAKMIQDDVSNGNFSWCAVDNCGIRNNDRLPKYLNLYINIDDSCNLHCPSCRRDHIMISQGPEFENRLKMIERIIQWLERYDKKVCVILSGNGDPLASHIIRPLIKNWSPNNNQNFMLKTNGLLIKKQLENLRIVNNIVHYSISVDAGTKEIYEDVRRPGKWELLIENFNFLQSINKNKITTLNFALQNKNYQDLENFIKLCQEYEFGGNIHEITDWGTWSQVDPKEHADVWTIQNGIFSDHDVLNKTHPNHNDAKQIILKHQHHKHITFSSSIMQQIS